jgi:membrane-bound lytic murein transglycosylase B
VHYVPRALATLAYADERRAKFAKKQLIAALKILQNGDISPDGMTGSWAGAMGHTQFIPTSYLLYAVDADNNGHRDIWNSVPDALATSANLLMKNGWDAGKTWGYEVAVPQGALKQVGKTHTLSQWAALGLTRPSGKGFKDGGSKAVLKMPAGSSGPGFLMTANFFTIKKYNASDSYAHCRWPARRRDRRLWRHEAALAAPGWRARRQGEVRAADPSEERSAIMTAKSTATSAADRRRPSQWFRAESACRRTASHRCRC